MKESSSLGLDFVIDKLTNSIENVQTGDNLPTEISLLSSFEINNITKKNGWNFNWKSEFKKPERDIYKITIVGNLKIIQGLVSLEVKKDYVFMHLIESAKFNIGKDKVYLGIPGNLVAFACKLSFQRGGDGYVSFIAKTKLIDHYINTLDAVHFGGHLMVITTESALKLIGKYFKE